MDGGDTTMTNMEKLLDDLSKAKLDELDIDQFQQYLYDMNDKSVWKNKKRDSIVNEFYISKYELWNERLIERVFYVNQKWEQKIKQYCNIYEVQRYLAGSRYKINKGIYVASYGGIRMIYWKSYNNCDWERSTNERFMINYGQCYSSQYINHYKLNDYEKLLKQTKHKYCGFKESGLDDEQLFWFLYQYEKHPQMEMIAKMGLMDVIRGSMNCLKWSQKGYKLLGIDNKNELETVNLCNRLGGLKYYRKHKENIRKYGLDSSHKILIYDILTQRNISISRKLIEYIDSTDRSSAYGYEYSSCCSDYIDYIGFCNTLGIPLTAAVRYPEDLKKAHDDMQDKIKINESKAVTDKIQKQVIEKLFKYRFADDDYVITPANSVQDLIEESKQLYHCVKTYANKYARGETAIFLVRKRDDVLHPFYTLELKDKKINQVRGLHNCDPIDEVTRFIKKWAKKYRFGTTIYQNY